MDPPDVQRHPHTHLTQLESLQIIGAAAKAHTNARYAVLFLWYIGRFFPPHTVCACRYVLVASIHTWRCSARPLTSPAGTSVGPCGTGVSAGRGYLEAQLEGVGQHVPPGALGSCPRVCDLRREARLQRGCIMQTQDSQRLHPCVLLHPTVQVVPRPLAPRHLHTAFPFVPG